MHYAFDLWLAREFPAVEFERYADDAVVHCAASPGPQVLAALRERMAEVGLELHPDKTRIVYCKDSNRRGSQSTRRSPSSGSRSGPARRGGKNGKRVHLVPARDQQGRPEENQRARCGPGGCTAGSTRHGRGDRDAGQPEGPGLDGLLRAFYRSALYPVLRRINTYLLRWIMKKYRTHSTWKKATRKLAEAARQRARGTSHTGPG